MSSMKVLILRFSSIGDILLTTPAIRALKQQLPHAEVHFCTKRMYEQLIQANPFINQCHYLDDNLLTLIRQLRAEQYTHIIDLHNNLRTALIKQALNARTYTVNKLNIRKWLYVRWKLDLLPEQHIVDRYLATLKPLGVVKDNLGLDYFIPDADQVDSRELPPTHQGGYVAYAIGGQHATKRLPLARMVELCRQLKEPIVLLGDSADRATGEALCQSLPNQLIYNACGRYTLNQSASLLQRARVVFSHDSGLMHMAAALQKTIYSIWGSTTPRFGMYPYKTQFFVLENNDLGCRPCSKIGHQRCPLHHFRCMNELPLVLDLPLRANQPEAISCH